MAGAWTAVRRVETTGHQHEPGRFPAPAAGTSVSALSIAFGMMVTTPRYLSALASGERTLFGLERSSPAAVPMGVLGVTWAVVSATVSLGDLGSSCALSSIAVGMQFGTNSLLRLGRARPLADPRLDSRETVTVGRSEACRRV